MRSLLSLLVPIAMLLAACELGGSGSSTPTEGNEEAYLNAELARAVRAGTLTPGSEAASQEAAVLPLPALETEFTRPAPLGDGAISAFVSRSEAGPVFLGVVFPGDALDGLPSAVSDGRYDITGADGAVVWHCCGHETAIDLPELAKTTTAFEHVVLNWNPHGHMPEGVYHAPHFDLHFYTISSEARLAIATPSAEAMCEIPGPGGAPVRAPLDCPTLERAMAPLPADMTPPDYASVGAVEPAMGNHLIDFGSPEFSEAGFSKTWIFGTFGGDLTFWEPMVTKAYLESGPFGCTEIKLPQAAPEAGPYPSRYCIRHFGGLDLYAVTLEGFTPLPQSSGVVE